MSQPYHAERRTESYSGFDALVGSSEVMVRLRSMIERVAPSNLPVLIEGPTGAGKELVARAIHQCSGKKGAFVPVNVCAITESMADDSLFGHVRGGFTGAIADRQGFLMEANQGSLFLDEVGSLPLAAQPRLLRAIELGEFRPVGARRDEHSAFRLIAASNEPLLSATQSKQFREDLYYRLCGVRLRVPPLKDRLEDIPELVVLFAGGDDMLTESAVDCLGQHCWPGNVRELKQAIGTLMVLHSPRVVTAQDVRELLNTYSVDGPLPAEARRLRDVLDKHGWDFEKAGIVLGLSRSQVYRRAKRLGIRRDRRNAGILVATRCAHLELSGEAGLRDGLS